MYCALGAIIAWAIYKSFFTPKRGTTGALAWSLSNGALTISGTGAMPDYGFFDDPDHAPWFKYCDLITTVAITNGVTRIGDNAFGGCSSLTSITMPNSVTTIGDYAFQDCSSLTSITIPNSVTTIGNDAFMDCSSLTSITVSSGNTAYALEDGVLFNKSKTIIIVCPEGKTGSYTIPDSVTTIGDRAFCDCWHLTSITIPNSVTTIGVQAFLDCFPLTSITIPNSVRTIGWRAFGGCFKLRNVVALSTTPPSITSGTTNISAFCGVPLSSATLTVSKGCKAAYQSASGWKDFGTIVEATP
jgi:hypothetical protein